MLDLLLATLLTTGEVQQVKSINWSSWLETSWLGGVSQPEMVPDPTAEAAIQNHLATLTSLGMPQAAQGLWIQIGNQVLGEHRGTDPIPAASLTKIPTTLAALSTWGTQHQFETQVGMTGRLENGVLEGDLVIQGSGDPLFVWEEAIALGNALNQLGIRQVAGNLVITGNFAMNFQADPQTAGELLKQGLNADLWNAEAATQYAQMPASTARPQVMINGSVIVTSEPPAVTPLIRHQSQPLSLILKAMNIFSNNFIAESLASQLGGGREVARKAAEAAGVPAEEIQLVNGSGLGVENRISPHAVTAMLITLQNALRSQQLNVADLFPVVGRERGTLGGRRIAPGTALKTGTLDEVSSLAGVLPTQRGLVWFAIIDIGTADLKTLHNGQDLLLQTLVSQWGSALPVPSEIQPNPAIKSYQEQLGDPSRNQIVR